MTSTSETLATMTDAELLAEKNRLQAEFEQRQTTRRQALSTQFTEATKFLAREAQNNSFGQSYIDEAEKASEYMPEGLRPWLPSNKWAVSSGLYVLDLSYRTKVDQVPTAPLPTPFIYDLVQHADSADRFRVNNMHLAGPLDSYLRARPEHWEAQPPLVQTDYDLTQD